MGPHFLGQVYAPESLSSVIAGTNVRQWTSRSLTDWLLVQLRACDVLLYEFHVCRPRSLTADVNRCRLITLS